MANNSIKVIIRTFSWKKSDLQFLFLLEHFLFTGSKCTYKLFAHRMYTFVVSNVIIVAWTKHTHNIHHTNPLKWIGEKKIQMNEMRFQPKNHLSESIYGFFFYILCMVLEHVSIDGFSVFFFLFCTISKYLILYIFLSAKMAVIQVPTSIPSDIHNFFFQLKICVWFESGELL